MLWYYTNIILYASTITSHHDEHKYVRGSLSAFV